MTACDPTATFGYDFYISDTSHSPSSTNDKVCLMLASVCRLRNVKQTLASKRQTNLNNKGTFMPAGDNESIFRKLMTDKFGETCLSGKKNFSLKLEGFDNVRISVDESIFVNDQKIFIEIDSGNMAKLLAGQYALLNGMYSGDKSKAIFLVIHYYRDIKTGKLYSRDRTLKNLNAIQYFNSKVSWIQFNAFNLEEFESIINNVSSLEELVQKVWPNNA